MRSSLPNMSLLLLLLENQGLVKAQFPEYVEMNEGKQADIFGSMNNLFAQIKKPSSDELGLLLPFYLAQTSFLGKK